MTSIVASDEATISSAPAMIGPVLFATRGTPTPSDPTLLYSTLLCYAMLYLTISSASHLCIPTRMQTGAAPRGARADARRTRRCARARARA